MDPVIQSIRDALAAEHPGADQIDFEVRKRNEYFDLLPHRLAYRRATLERAKRGAA